jgi:hypothetical protein
MSRLQSSRPELDAPEVVHISKLNRSQTTLYSSQGQRTDCKSVVSRAVRTLFWLLIAYWRLSAAVGTSPGRLVETDSTINIIHEWPEDVAGTLNILGEQFSPHGLSVDFAKNLILTSDFVVPVTILKPSLGIQRANTLRLWNLAQKTIISTITIPNVRPLPTMIVPC